MEPDDPVAALRAREHVTLADGRRLEYLELGDPTGVPAIYLHGTPSSASEARWLHRQSRAHGVRLVSVDRPGYLQSERGADSSLLGVARDVDQLAQSLHLDRFAVVGFSGGGGYTVAVAHAAADRVTVAHVGGGMGSMAGGKVTGLSAGRRLMLGGTAKAPGLAAPLVGLMLGRQGRTLEKKLGAPTYAALELLTGAARGAQLAAVEEYVRSCSPDELRAEISDYIAATSDTDAAIGDVVAIARPWPFGLDEVKTQVELWHGTDDPAVPLAYAEDLASKLGNARLHTFDGEGHFVMHTHGDEIVASIRAAAGA